METKNVIRALNILLDLLGEEPVNRLLRKLDEPDSDPDRVFRVTLKSLGDKGAVAYRKRMIEMFSSPGDLDSIINNFEKDMSETLLMAGTVPFTFQIAGKYTDLIGALELGNVAPEAKKETYVDFLKSDAEDAPEFWQVARFMPIRYVTYQLFEVEYPWDMHFRSLDESGPLLEMTA